MRGAILAAAQRDPGAEMGFRRTASDESGEEKNAEGE